MQSLHIFFRITTIYTVGAVTMRKRHSFVQHAFVHTIWYVWVVIRLEKTGSVILAINWSWLNRIGNNGKQWIVFKTKNRSKFYIFRKFDETLLEIVIERLITYEEVRISNSEPFAFNNNFFLIVQVFSQHILWITWSIDISSNQKHYRFGWNREESKGKSLQNTRRAINRYQMDQAQLCNCFFG